MTTTVYDAAGQATASINPMGEVAFTAYNDADRVVASINPMGEVTTTVYDASWGNFRTSVKNGALCLVSARSMVMTAI